MIVRTEKGSGYMFGKTFATMRKIAVVLLVVCALVPSKVLAADGPADGVLELYAAVDKCYAGAIQYWWDVDNYMVRFKNHDPLVFGVGTEDIVAVVYHRRNLVYGCNATGPPMMIQWTDEGPWKSGKISVQYLFWGKIREMTEGVRFDRTLYPASLTVKRPYNIADSIVIVYSMPTVTPNDKELMKQNTTYIPLACGIISDNEMSRAAFRKTLNKSPTRSTAGKIVWKIFKTIFFVIEMIAYFYLWFVLFVILCTSILCFREF